MQIPQQNNEVSVPPETTIVKTVTRRAPRAAAKTKPAPAPETAAPAAPGAATATPVEAKPDKRLKPKKAKLVRESFNLPMLDYLMLETLKLRGEKLGHPVKKNGLIRAGIKALATLSDANFLTLLKSVSKSKSNAV